MLRDAEKRLISQIREALTDSSAAEFVDLVAFGACFTRWQVREYSDYLRGQPALSMPVALLASSFAPATVTLDSVKRMRELFSDVTLGYIPRSKGWIFSEPEERSAMPPLVRALVALHARASRV